MLIIDMIYLNIDNYAWVVPFRDAAEKRILITAYPGRKFTAKYMKDGLKKNITSNGPDNLTRKVLIGLTTGEITFFTLFMHQCLEENICR